MKKLVAGIGVLFLTAGIGAQRGAPPRPAAPAQPAAGYSGPRTPDRKPDLNGHLTVCRGFTENGDLVINDPWTDLKVESVRHIYKRKNVQCAWATSHNTVYLVYPETVKPPPDRLGHWFDGEGF